MLFRFAAPIITALSLCRSTLGLPLVVPRDNSARDNSTPLRNIAYVQTFTDSSGNFLDLTELATKNSGVTHVILASLHLDSPTEIHLNDNDINSSYWDPLWPMVESLQSSGIKVMLMMGGAAHGSYVNLANNFDTYYPILLQILQDHNLDGFDFDVEENVALSVLLRLAQQFDADLGSDFILTAAPVASALRNGGNLNNVSWTDLDAAGVSSVRPNGKLFNWFNAQFYEGWGSPDEASYEAVINNGWDPSRIVMGTIVSTKAGFGWTPLATLATDIADIRAKYPDFGGVFGWEYGVAGVSDGVSPVDWETEIGKNLAA